MKQAMKIIKVKRISLKEVDLLRKAGYIVCIPKEGK